MTTRLHLTIGEVLSLLREEFPDVSISKIRFLESQGLVDPERTPSGYRKFYDHDVERLRWILLQQKEHFLPLKVIRDRLDSDGDGEGPAGDELPAGPGPDPAPVEGPAPVEVADLLEAEAAPRADAALSPDPSPRAEARPQAEPVPDPDPEPVASTPVPPPRPAPASVPSADRRAAAQQVRAREADEAVADGVGAGGRHAAQPDVYTAGELADAVGATPALIRELEQFGILKAGANVGGVAYFDADAIHLARIGARFAELGVEPRHLRPWRNGADREAGLFEQLVMPLLRQRNPQARLEAAERLRELIDLGGDLRAGLIADAVRSIR